MAAGPPVLCDKRGTDGLCLRRGRIRRALPGELCSLAKPLTGFLPGNQRGKPGKRPGFLFSDPNLAVSLKPSPGLGRCSAPVLAGSWLQGRNVRGSRPRREEEMGWELCVWFP